MQDKLQKIQLTLKAPKGQYNSFSKFYYRNCEDILEAVKPLLEDLGLIILLSDEVVQVGVYNYVKATATLQDKDKGQISVTAFAREASIKKGMDDMQITGAASSYARKYALNGLFAIDDTKDSDSHDNTKPAQKDTDTVTAQQKQQLKNTMVKLGMDNDAMGLLVETVLEKPTIDTYGDYKKVLSELETV